MLPDADTLGELHDRFAWRVPERYNLGRDVCDRWADREPGRLAIIDVGERSVTASGTASEPRECSFAELRARSNRLANVLIAAGVRGLARGPGSERLGRTTAHAGSEPGEVGDRVGVLLPQCLETAVAHIAVTKLGGVSIPLFTLFGEEALRHRLRDSGAVALITDAAGAAKVATMRDELPALRTVLSIDGDSDGAFDVEAVCAAASDAFEPVDTLADDPALLIYTSGTTGNPKGALHAHRVLLGHLPGVELSHDLLPQPGDRLWTPADWAWIGGLLDVLMPALHHGVPVVACRFAKFTAEAAFALMHEQGVRNVFLPPTAIKLMRAVPRERVPSLDLRSVASGGEPLGAELLEWGRDAFGTTINEFYGQTECNMVVSSCAALEVPVPGAMGRAVPGHGVDVIDATTGVPVADDAEGAIAVRAPDPVMFLGYWNNAAATADKFVDGPTGRWLLTGDRGTRDADGRLRFLARDDDVIGSAGYRIGPGEVENCLLGHPAVRVAGVVGQPDDVRGQIVVAYVLLADGVVASQALADELARHVKTRLSAHEYPRAVRFVDEMPMTTTGKIVRAALRQRALEDASA